MAARVELAGMYVVNMLMLTDDGRTYRQVRK
jgi:hypothetical protein